MKKLLFILLATTLTACSTGGHSVMNSFQSLETHLSDKKELTQKLRSQQVTPVALNSLQFKMLSTGGDNRIDISANSPIVNFPEGNSFVAALLLPEKISKFTFALQSVAGTTVFMPTVLFLDKDFQEVTRIDSIKLNARNLFLMEKEIGEEVASRVTFIIVYSKNSELDGKTELVNIAREYEIANGMDVADFTYPRIYAKHSPIGNLNILLKDVFFNAATVGKNADLIVAKPAIASVTENTLLQEISDAVEENNISGALQLVEEAEKAGSTKAQSHFIEALKKQQK